MASTLTSPDRRTPGAALRTRPGRWGLIGAAAVVAVVALAGCGSDGDDGGDAGSGDVTGDERVAGGGDTTNGGAGDSEADSGDASGSAASITLTIEDGTVYELTDISSCDTSATDPNAFPIATGYSLSGRTADGEFRFSAGRAGFEEDAAVFSGSLDGDFDEDGRNNAMLYSLDGDGTDLVVDGTRVSGTIVADAVAPTRPHGDSTTIVVEAAC